MYIKSIKYNNDQVVIYTPSNEITGYINQTTRGYYLCLNDYFNDYLFTKFNINKGHIQSKALGYVDTIGIFPFCRTKNDVKILLKVIQKQTKIQYSKNEI